VILIQMSYFPSLLRIKKFVCQFCDGRKYTARSSLLRHYKTYHAQMKQQPIIELHDDKEVLCDKCGELFSLESFETHVKKHHEIQQNYIVYICQQCNLQMTVKNWSSSAVCNIIIASNKVYSFFVSEEMAEKMLRLHKFSCNICYRSFKTESLLNLHQMSHCYRCIICSEGVCLCIFNDEKGLLNSCIPIEINPCVFCEESFFQWDLGLHLRCCAKRYINQLN